MQNKQQKSCPIKLIIYHNEQLYKSQYEKEILWVTAHETFEFRDQTSENEKISFWQLAKIIFSDSITKKKGLTTN